MRRCAVVLLSLLFAVPTASSAHAYGGACAGVTAEGRSVPAPTSEDVCAPYYYGPQICEEWTTNVSTGEAVVGVRVCIP
ncbi:MAG: hypothetical protein QOE45_369 [Frankiaceae bacterium]|jgi:hypothetical protein|nr:hypothetical protein [Frankiaceae bacterium]